MEVIFIFIEWIEAHPVTSGAIGVIIMGIIHFIRKKYSNPNIKSVFYTFGKKYKVTCVHEFVPADRSSGYISHQHSRPEQWNKFIDIKTSLCGLRHHVIPKDTEKILTVVICKTPFSKEKMIHFNR